MNTNTPSHQPVYTSVPQNTMQNGVDSYYTSPQANCTLQYQQYQQQPQQQAQQQSQYQQVHMAYLSKVGTSVLEEIKTVNINLVKLNSTIKESRRHHRTECDVKFKADQITVPILFTSPTTTQQENSRDEEQDASTLSNKRPLSNNQDDTGPNKRVGSTGRGAHMKSTNNHKKTKKYKSELLCLFVKLQLKITEVIFTAVFYMRELRRQNRERLALEEEERQRIERERREKEALERAKSAVDKEREIQEIIRRHSQTDYGDTYTVDHENIHYQTHPQSRSQEQGFIEQGRRYESRVQVEPVDLRLPSHNTTIRDRARRNSALEQEKQKIELEMKRLKEREQQLLIEERNEDISDTDSVYEDQLGYFETRDVTGSLTHVKDKQRVSHAQSHTGDKIDSIPRDGENDFEFEKELEWIEKKAAEYDNSLALLSSTRRDGHEDHALQGKQNRLPGSQDTDFQKKQGVSEAHFEADRVRYKTERMYNDKYTYDEDLDTGRHLKGNNAFVENNIDIDKADDEEETEIKRRIQKLQSQEKTAELKLKSKQMLKEMRLKEIEVERLLREKQEKRRLKEKRLNDLKEQERALERSLLEKEKALKVIEKEMSNDYEYTDIQPTIKKTIHRNQWRSPILDDKDKVVDIVERQITEREKVKSHIYKPTVPKLVETSFEEWKIEVEVMMKSGLYHEDILRQAVRNSLSGNTKRILLTLGTDVSTREIVDKLETIYGNVRSGESVLGEFYQSKQGKDETIAEWGIRLESMLQIALEKNQIHKSQKDEMLRSRFWRYLYNDDLKNATRLGYETAKDFEDLQRKIRKEECEMSLTKDAKVTDTPKQINSQQASYKEQLTILKELTDKMKNMETKLEELTRDRNQSRHNSERRSSNREYQESWNQYRGRGRAPFRSRGFGYRGRGYRDESRRFDTARNRDYDSRGSEKRKPDQQERKPIQNNNERYDNAKADTKKEETNAKESLN
ncbi:trichohyalin-like [Mercenaria mercenaria]|uniref:trichohyalin-like n=1 Tax=Mercenaria mercenaria TaxID=6596 RepID=UPI00234EC0B9|nr:trichohyalin-like [Mercenaria mercenaria]